MADEQTNNIAPAPIQYATPKGVSRAWLPCIVGLFVWGALVLVPVPLIIGMVIIDAIWNEASLWRPDDYGVLCCMAFGICLLLGLPPIITARRMMRSNLKGVRFTVVIMAVPAVFAMLFSVIGFLSILGESHEDWWMTGLVTVAAMALFGSVLWLAVKLSNIAAISRQTKKTTGLT